MSAAPWLTLTIACPSEDLAALTAEGLVACGATAVEELPGAVRTWLPCEGAADALVRDVLRALRERTGVELEAHWQVQQAADWTQEWRRGLRPRRIGARIVVAPTWTQPELEPDDVLLTIDPEMAFGTGEHGTTRGMLRLLQRAVRPGMRVLDVGTGSAILAIAVVLLGAASADAVESDPDALVNARDNVARHGVAASVRLEQALVDEAWLARRAPYDMILANILSGVIRPLLPAFRRALSPPGVLLLSGILQEEAAAVIGDADAAGFRVVVEDLEDEWWSGLLT
jgi:ribosomal protein L11 methyltransferase